MNDYQRALNNLPFDPDHNERMIHMLKEHTHSKSQKNTPILLKKCARIALVAAALSVLLTTVVFAAIKLLTPAEVANYFGDTALAAAFESDEAVIINQEKTVGDYIITLNGIVSGVDLEEYVENRDTSYIVLSVRYSDGRAITPGETWESDPICRFAASPYVQGSAPSEVNSFTLESSATKGVLDNVLYMLFETADLEQFQDKQVYIGVVESDDVFSLVNDEKCPFALAENGAIVLKEHAEENMPCALFELPI